MSNDKFMIKKIELEGLIETLTDLWDKGLDYIDLSTNEEGTRLSIYFFEEYLSDEAKKELNKETETNISDLDINELI